MEQPLALGITVCIGLVLVLLALGLRIYAVLGLAGVIAGYFLVGHQSFQMLKLIPFTSTNVWTLTAIPLFIFIGFYCRECGISAKLYDGAAAFLSRLPGGLLHANIGASAMFAAITGSPTATAATISSVALPELKRRGYDKKMMLGSLVVGGTLGPIIPPSIDFIVYGSITAVSIGKLFFAGLIPGVLAALMYMTYIGLWALYNPQGAPKGEKPTIKTLLISARGLLPILVTAVVVLGGIYLGIFTPTESGAVGCVLVMIAALIMTRRFEWRSLVNSMLNTINLTSFIMLIILGSSVLQNTLAALRLPHRLAEWVASQAPSPVFFILFVFLLYLVLGCVMDSLPILIMSVPIFFPIAVALGFDPIHFGVLIVFFTELGCITPPVGVVLYVVQQVRGTGSIGDVYRGVIPFIFIMIGVSGIVFVFPILSTWLPSLMITR